MDENLNQAPSQYVPAQDGTSGSFPVKKIVSLVIGAVVVISLLLLFIFVVLPRFTSGDNKNVNLVYWDVWEDVAPIEEAAKQFTQANPNIKITIQKQDPKSLGKYTERLKTRIQNGTGPDVFRYHESWLPELFPYLMPVPQDVIAATELDKKYYPTISNDLTHSGAYFGVPIHFDTLALFINTELYKNGGLTRYPSDWNDMVDFARQLTVKDEATGKITQSGAALGTFDNIAHAPDIISLLMVQNKANLTNLAGPSKKNAVDALDFYTSFAKGDSKVWDDTLENSKMAFGKGKVAMYIGYSWDVFELKQINPQLQYAIVPVPYLPVENSAPRKWTIASYWAEGVSAKTKYQKEAFEFLKFLASKKTMEQLYTQESKIRSFGELYPRSDMAAQLKSNSLIYPFVSQGPEAKSTIFASDTYDNAMVDELNKYLGDAVRSVLDNNSSETAIDTLAAGVSQKITQYAGSGK